MLPFFSCSNIEMMEFIWIDHVRAYNMEHIKLFQRGALEYFKNLKYGRDYCNRPYIALRKPFRAHDKSVQMDLILASLLTLLNNNKAELVYEALGKEFDTYFIMVCFGTTFLIYKYFIGGVRYINKYQTASWWLNFIDEVGYDSGYAELYRECRHIVFEYEDHF